MQIGLHLTNEKQEIKFRCNTNFIRGGKDVTLILTECSQLPAGFLMLPYTFASVSIEGYGTINSAVLVTEIDEKTKTTKICFENTRKTQ